jgi:hypothetical protein
MINKQNNTNPFLKTTRKSVFILLPLFAFFLATLNNSCKVYRFKDVSIPDSIKTVKVNFIENRARYVNPQLSPRLTDKLRQKIVNQTRLTQTNGDNPDWEISGSITEYSISTAAISNQQNATDRLNVTVSITLYDRLANKSQDYQVTHSFDFPAIQSLQQAEVSKADDIINTMTDEIFNRLFSNW